MADQDWVISGDAQDPAITPPQQISNVSPTTAAPSPSILQKIQMLIDSHTSPEAKARLQKSNEATQRVAGYVPGASQVTSGIEQLGQGQGTTGLTDLLEGGGKALAASSPETLLASPGAALAGGIVGTGAGIGGDYLSQVLGVPPDKAHFLGDIIGGITGAGTFGKTQGMTGKQALSAAGAAKDLLNPFNWGKRASEAGADLSDILSGKPTSNQKLMELRQKTAELRAALLQRKVEGKPISAQELQTLADLTKWTGGPQAVNPTENNSINIPSFQTLSTGTTNPLPPKPAFSPLPPLQPMDQSPLIDLSQKVQGPKVQQRTPQGTFSKAGPTWIEDFLNRLADIEKKKKNP